MSLINIKPALKLSDFDDLYRQLSFLVVHEGVIDVALPLELTNSFFALTCSLIQFISTWVRTEQRGKLIIDLKNEPETLYRFYQEDFAFPVIAIAWNDVEIVNSTGENIRPMLRFYQNDFIIRMHSLEPQKGLKALLTHVDHLPRTAGILPYFEVQGDFITDEEELSRTLQPLIFDHILSYDRQKLQEFMPVYEEVIGVIAELMKNTWDWGRKDENFKPLSPNVRGLFIRFFKRKRAHLLADYRKDLPVRQYLEEEGLFEENSLGQIHFLEISVFDSGSGFVKKYMDEDKHVLTETDIIKKCLIKGQTSSYGIYRKQKGFGLDRILRIINNKGFLRIRTDKYCLYRNMRRSPHQTLNSSQYNEVDLFDWASGKNGIYTRLPYASGSTLSILYPLSDQFSKK